MSDNFNWLGPALAGAIVPILLTWMMRKSSQEAKVYDGYTWIEYGRVWKGFTILSGALVVGLCILWFVVPSKDKVPVSYIILLFGGLTLPLVLEFFFVKIGYNHEEIVCRSGWRKTRRIPWSDVISYRFSISMQWWLIRTKEHGFIRAHVYLSGLQVLLSELERRKIEKERG